MRTILTGMVAFMAVVTLATVANGAVVTYTLSINDSGSGTVGTGKWAIFAEVTGGSAGIASYSLDIQNWTKISQYGPKVAFSDGSDTYNCGFTLLRTGSNASPISASQDTINTSTAIAVYGIGQTAGNLSDLNPGPANDPPFTESGAVQKSYNARVLLAYGSFTYVAPGNAANPLWKDGGVITGNVFDTDSGWDTSAGDLTLATTNLIPEPATMGLLAIGAIGVITRRRRRA